MNKAHARRLKMERIRKGDDYRSKTKKQDCEFLVGKDDATYVSAINHENENPACRMNLEFCSFFQIFDFFDFE